MIKSFYRALEDEYRGSRELVKTRLQVYLPFVLPLSAAFPELKAFDVGCGRGEWLELLGEHGVQAYGIDLDESMLAACREHGLSVGAGDAIDHLKSLADASLLVVSAFHVVEHLTFAEVQSLLDEARRVLVPGGLLLLETPNPENLVVGTASFYIDPTHQRPLPSQLLLFLARHHGYVSAKLLRLQEDPALRQCAAPGIYDVLGGSSPDYAVVAQVAGGQLPALPEFSVDYGIALLELANRYDEALRRELQARQQEGQAAQAQARAAQVSARAAQALAEALQAQLAESRTMIAEVQVQAEAALALARTNQDRITAVFTSRSWRLTRPLRWLSGLFRSRPDGS